MWLHSWFWAQQSLLSNVTCFNRGEATNTTFTVWDFKEIRLVPTIYMIDWLVVNANCSSIPAISWRDHLYVAHSRWASEPTPSMRFNFRYRYLKCYFEHHRFHQDNQRNVLRYQKGNQSHQNIINIFFLIFSFEGFHRRQDFWMPIFNRLCNKYYLSVCLRGISCIWN